MLRFLAFVTPSVFIAWEKTVPKLELPYLPGEKRKILGRLVGELSALPGVAAVVLGGSYARGTHHETSDLDVGLFYAEADPFALEDIRRVADALSVRGQATVSDFYGWGPWVNGDAWIPTEAGKVDFLYRNLEQVERTIQEARRGVIHHDYNQQPTFGFYSVAYLAEVNIAVPLYDPHHHVARLKSLVAPYPPQLKKAVTTDSLLNIDFTLPQARKFASDGDAYNAVGCIARIASCLVQALFALNETYFISDKKVMNVIQTFALLPPNFVSRLSGVLTRPGESAYEFTRSLGVLERIWYETVALANGTYEVRYNPPQSRTERSARTAGE